MAVVRGQFDELLVPGARKVFIDEYQELEATYPQVFTVDTSGKAFEDDLVMTGLPIAPERPEGEPIPFDRPKFRGKVRYIHTGYGLGYEITREAVEDDLYQALNSQGAGNLARSMREAEEVSAAAVFNNMFTTVQAYDGVSVLNSSHTLVDGSTLANRPSTDADVSVSALKSSLERFFNLQTDRNLRIRMMPDRIMVNHNNWWNVREILGTQVVTGASSGGEITSITSLNATNVVTEMGLMPIRWSYLTDDDAWYVMAPKAQVRVFFYWRRQPDPVNDFMDREQVAWFGITGRWSSGVTDWHGLDGSTGA